MSASVSSKPAVKSEELWQRVRCAVHILALLALAPLSMALSCVWWAVAVLAGEVESRTALPASHRKTVMLTGGKMSKALHFARCLWKAGHKVILVETEQYWCVGSRFSRAVSAFETVRCPRVDPAGYVADLVAVARKHSVDLFIPVSSPVVSVYDSEVKEVLESQPGGARSMHFTHEFTTMVDCKHSFGSYCREKGLSAPETFRVNSDAEAREFNTKLAARGPGTRFVLKNLEYDAMHRLDLFCLPAPAQKLEEYLAKLKSDGTPISAHHPWQLQEFVNGEEYSAMVVLRNSDVRMITVGSSSASQLNYVALPPSEHRAAQLIDDWVRRFVQSLEPGVGGQICFDFIFDEARDVVKVLECNPRVHSQSCVFASDAEQKQLGGLLVEENSSSPPSPRLAAAHAKSKKRILRPRAPLKRLYWLYNELFKLVPNGAFFKYNSGKEGSSLQTFFRRLLLERDADFDPSDPLPFVLRNHFQLPARLTYTLLAGRTWKKCDFCIGKVVEINGD